MQQPTNFPLKEAKFNLKKKKNWGLGKGSVSFITMFLFLNNFYFLTH